MMSKETIEQLQAAIEEAMLELVDAKARNLHEFVDVLNHDIRKYRRAIKKLQADQ
jgi:ribosomal protein L29